MIDAASCLAAGDCMVVTNGVLYIAVGIFAVCAALLLMLLFTYMWTPALTFFIAKIKHRSILYIENRAQRGKFFMAGKSHDGLVDVNGVGPYMLTENSHSIEHKSGVSLFKGFGEFAGTVPGLYGYIIQRLRAEGIKLNNIEDLKKLVSDWKEDPNLTDAQKKKLAEYEMRLMPYQTIKLHDLANMFPFNITPSMIESKMQYKLAMKQQLWNKFNIQTAVMAGIFLICAALAIGLAWKFLGGGASPGPIEIHIDPGMLQAAGQVIVENVTG